MIFYIYTHNIKKGMKFMITSLEYKYDTSGTDIGYVIGDFDVVNANDFIPLYIPKLMSSIEQADDINTSTVAIESPNYIFCNAPSNRPVNKTRMKVQNYILAESKYDFPEGLKNGDKVSVDIVNDSLRNIRFNKYDCKGLSNKNGGLEDGFVIYGDYGMDGDN